MTKCLKWRGGWKKGATYASPEAQGSKTWTV